MVLAAVDPESLRQITIDPWEIILAIGVLILALILARMMRRWVRDVSAHLQGLDDGMRELAARITSYTILFIGFGVALSVLGAPTQPLLAAAVIFGVVLALSLRGIADNFASGIVIQSRGTIRLGDEIAALGYQGSVREMNGRAVVIETDDGATVHLPNAKILTNPFVNLSAGGRWRSRVQITSESGGGIARSQVLTIVRDTPGVAADPPPETHTLRTEPGGVVLSVSFWHISSEGPRVMSEVVDALAARFPDTTVSASPPGPFPSPVPNVTPSA